jgi:hypothetical protein
MRKVKLLIHIETPDHASGVVLVRAHVAATKVKVSMGITQPTSRISLSSSISFVNGGDIAHGDL